MMLNLIFLGAPGAGKGTQSDFVSSKYGIPQISTGSILRNEMALETELGKKIKSVMESGKLVDDADVVQLVKKRISDSDCDKGFILDGFPRNIVQAKELDALLSSMDKKITCVIEIKVSDDVIISRMSGRRVCNECGATYHVKYNKPNIQDICDKCGSKLSIRADDRADVVCDRLKIYHEQTAPLSKYYLQKGILKTVDGSEDITHIQSLVVKAIEAK